MEKYSSWWRGAPAKGVGRVTGARVRVSPSPPRERSFCLMQKGLFQLNKPLRICEIRLTASEIAVGSEMSADEGRFIFYISLLIAHW